MNWTEPFHGVQHFGVFGSKTNWATVEDHGSFATLYRWFPGCGFSPTTHDFESVAEAKAIGETFVYSSARE